MEQVKVILTLAVSVYLIVINTVGALCMGSDKLRAIEHRFRIRETTLFLVSLIGGSLGTFTAMLCFRHKTKHWYFMVFMPLILIIQLVLAALYIKTLF